MTSLRHGILCLNVQRRWKHRCPYKLHCHWSNISIILGLSNNGSRWVFGPPSLLLTYIYLDLPTSIRSGYSTGSFGCPTVLHCTEPYPVCGTSMAAPLVWPCLPLDRHTGYSNSMIAVPVLYIYYAYILSALVLCHVHLFGTVGLPTGTRVRALLIYSGARGTRA